MTDTPNQTTSPPVLDYWIFVAIFFLLFFDMILGAKMGADAREYFNWQRYFDSFDLSVLAGYPKSLRGLPLVQWQYGTGLLAAIPGMAFRLPIPMQITATFLGIANLLLFVFVARNYAKRTDILLLVTASLLLFTPAGYYFDAYSSEGLTVLLVLCGLCCIEWHRSRFLSLYLRALLLGATFYFMLLVKSQNIIVCVALTLIFLLDFHASSKLRVSYSQLLKVSLAVALPPATAVGFLAAFNLVVYGNAFVSPYAFGDTEYSALSLGHLKIFEVLFSSWHGLFFYHPLLVVPIYWLIRSAKTPSISLIVLIAFVLQLLLQSSWYCWWMGIGTFGARSFVGISILLVYAVLRCHQQRTMRILNSSRYLAVLAVIATFEAYLIRRGTVNFVDYHSFVHDLATRSSLVTFTAYSIFGLAAFCVSQRFVIDPRIIWIIYIVGLYPLANFIRVARFAGDSLAFPRLIIVATAAVVVVAAITLAFQALPRRSLAEPMLITARKNSARALVTFAACVCLVSMVAQIATLTIFSATAVSNFSGGRLFDCQEQIETLDEYNMIHGYEQDKAALSAFLTRSGCFDGA